MSKDIEDIFSNAFGEFEQTPSERVWKGIAKDREEKQRLGITEATPESEMTHGLSNLAAEPGEGVWQAIAHNRFMKLMQRKMLRIAAAILLLLGIGLAANSLVEREEGSGKMEDGSGKMEVGSREIEVGSGKMGDGSGKMEVGSGEMEVGSGKMGEGSVGQSTVGNVKAKETGEQEVKSSQQLPVASQQSSSTQHSTTESSETTAKSSEVSNPESTTGNQQPASDNQSIAVAPKNPAALPTAEPDMSKLPKPKRMNSPHKDHFFYIPTVASGNKYGNNYTKYNSQTDLNNEGSRLKFGVALGWEFYTKYKTTGVNKYYERMRGVAYEGQPKGVSASFSASINLNRYLYLQTGANIVNRWASPNYEATFGHTVMTVDGFGNTTFVDVTDYEIHAVTRYSLTHLEIPIMVGVTLGEGRLSGHIVAGPSYNKLIDKKGFMLSAVNMRAVHLDNATAHNFAKANWGCIVNAGGSWQIKHEWSLSTDLTYKYYSNMFGNSYPATQTMYGLGVNVGIRYHLR